MATRAFPLNPSTWTLTATCDPFPLACASHLLPLLPTPPVSSFEFTTCYPYPFPALHAHTLQPRVTLPFDMEDGGGLLKTRQRAQQTLRLIKVIGAIVSVGLIFTALWYLRNLPTKPPRDDTEALEGGPPRLLNMMAPGHLHTC